MRATLAFNGLIQFNQVFHGTYWEFDDAECQTVRLRDVNYLKNGKW